MLQTPKKQQKRLKHYMVINMDYEKPIFYLKSLEAVVSDAIQTLSNNPSKNELEKLKKTLENEENTVYEISYILGELLFIYDSIHEPFVKKEAV